MRLSYAQFLEDHHLALVLGDRREGFYVDIGGGHPVADNVSFHFYLMGWRGIVAEPQANLAALYATIRPRDIVIGDLVGREAGEVDFHTVDHLHGFSTMVEANAAGAREFGAGYRTTRKRVRPLRDVLAEHGAPRIDFLKIDVEGAEPDVLAGMDWRKYRPSVLCIEAIAPGTALPSHEQWEAQVLAADYAFAFADGINRFYVAKEEAALKARFPEKPAPWDVVTHFYELGRPHERDDHPDRALAERLVRGFLAGLGTMSEAEIMALLQRSAGRDGLEQGDVLRALLIGKADFPGRDAPRAAGFDDRIRAAVGRISAQYDGGMVNE